MRLLALLVLLTASPLGATATRIVVEAAGAAAPCDCDNDDDDEDRGGDGDDDCSPLCDDCICSLGVRVVPSISILTLDLAPAPAVVIDVADVVAGEEVTSPPRAPSLMGVFHPPRR